VAAALQVTTDQLTHLGWPLFLRFERMGQGSDDSSTHQSAGSRIGAGPSPSRVSMGRPRLSTAIWNDGRAPMDRLAARLFRVFLAGKQVPEDPRMIGFLARFFRPLRFFSKKKMTEGKRIQKEVLARGSFFFCVAMLLKDSIFV
jgi:hypothetical protein